jgi:hypothetical protein
MRQVLGIITLLVGGIGVACGADLEHIRPSARWLASERLKGTLFHDTNIEPSAPLLLAPIQEGRTAAGAPITLRGEHHLLVLPKPGQPIRFRLKTIATRPPLEQSSYALFNAAGEDLGNGLVAAGQEKDIVLEARGSGPYVLLLNSGAASSTVTQVSVIDSPWAIDTRAKPPYRRGPMHYHFLHDLKFAGFNLAMVDVEYSPQEFLTDDGLEKWSKAVGGWAEAARRYQLRMMYAIDLGGTAAEVASWGDLPKGLYIKHDAKAPLAPCPLQKLYWERILLRRGREVAKMSLKNPYVVGYGIDPEMYQCWLYGHYMLGGTCFCDHCLGGFLRRQGLPETTLQKNPSGQQRHQWLVKQKLLPQYETYLEDQMREIAAWCRDELHRINPNLLLCAYVLDIGNWFCRGLARGLGEPDLPVINFCETTYYAVGYDRPWLAKTIGNFKEWGANCLQGSALWDMYFPPTADGYMAAHAYNLGVRAEGWWYWPGDRLYEGPRNIDAYQGQPAHKAGYWHAAALANAQIDLAMHEPGRASPLDDARKIPWQDMYVEKEDHWKRDSGVSRIEEPACTIRLAQPARLYFAVPRRATTVEIGALARGADNGAVVALFDPSGKPAGELQGKLDTTRSISCAAREGFWTLDVREQLGLSFRDVGLLVTPSVPVSTSKETMLMTPGKQPGLVAYWAMDEGRGQTVADTSQKVAYNGTLRGGRWIKGLHGSALAFDGRNGGVSVAGADSLNGLTECTLSAWVRLDALPERGRGATLIGKGPEAPVQHFWWWIGYPPSYELILEVGNEKLPYGHGFGSSALKWELGRWYHVTVVFRSDGRTTSAAHYRDGQLLGTQTARQAFNTGDYDLLLGTYGTLHFLNGALDEVKIWDRALGAEEIHEEFQRLKP